MIIFDESGFDGQPRAQAALRAGRRGRGHRRAARRCLFAVVAGSHEARVVFPRSPGLERADERTRRHAKAALAGVEPTGGTAIGSWLRLARTLLAEQPGAIRHAILLTDGRDEHETADELADGRRRLRGPVHLRLPRDRRRLVGARAAPGRPRPARLVRQDRRAGRRWPTTSAAMMAASMRKAVAEVALRVWTPVGATVRLVKQAAPDPVDLTDRRLPATARRSASTRPGRGAPSSATSTWPCEVPPGAVDSGTAGLPGALVRAAARRRPAAAGTDLRPDPARRRAGVAPAGHGQRDLDRRPGPLHRPAPAGAAQPRPAGGRGGRRRGPGRVRGRQPPAGRGVAGRRARAIAQRAGMHALVARIDDMRDPVTGTYQITPPDMLDIGVESSKQDALAGPARPDRRRIGV